MWFYFALFFNLIKKTGENFWKLFIFKFKIRCQRWKTKKKIRLREPSFLCQLVGVRFRRRYMKLMYLSISQLITDFVIEEVWLFWSNPIIMLIFSFHEKTGLLSRISASHWAPNHCILSTVFKSWSQFFWFHFYVFRQIFLWPSQPKILNLFSSITLFSKSQSPCQYV